MLQIIYGLPGTGKTTAVYHQIEQKVKLHKPVIFIVPEQLSYESEKVLCGLLGEKEALNVQVLSFTRLCHKIFYKFGQVAGNFVNPTAKYLLMSTALEEVRDSLQIYQVQAGKTTFVPTVLDMISELKNAGVQPDALYHAAAAANSSEKLTDKLKDAAIIYQAYQALLESGYQDPSDNITRAMKICAGKHFFKGYSIFIDSFTAFMAPELLFIEQMLSESDEVIVTACCDEWTAQNDKQHTHLFEPVQKTIRQLIRAAGRAQTPVKTPVHLTQFLRQKNEPLKHLTSSYLLKDKPYFQAQNDIKIIQCGDIPDEIETIAKQINTLVLDYGYRYREIAVITRDLSEYKDFIQDIFAQYQIPFHMDIRESAENYPLVQLIVSALLAISGSFDTGQLISLSKIPLLGIPEEDAYELECYCFLWNIRGKLWLKPFLNHPDGLSLKTSPESEMRLARIEDARKALITPLLTLKGTLQKPNGQAFAHGIYDYLISTGAVDRLKELYDVQAEGWYVDTQSELFDGVMDILDFFHRLLGTRPLPLKRLIELFRLAIQSFDVGKLPQTLDQVIVGTADKIRPVNIRAAFVCGAVEGEFPLHFSGSGLFSEREREQMVHQGIEIHTVKSTLIALERFYTYFSITIPSERLVLSYPTRSIAGTEKKGSLLVRTALSLFPHCMYSSMDQNPLLGISNEDLLFDLLCRTYREDNALTASLRQFFSNTVKMKALENAMHTYEDKDYKMDDASIAKALFGKNLSLSPSKLERYYSCPFSYFCDSGLRLRRRRKVEFSALESGSLIHYVLEYMVRTYIAENKPLPSNQKLREEIASLIGDYLSERIEDSTVVDKRFKYLFTRLVGMLSRLVYRITDEFGQSGFKPFAFELPINFESDNKPVVLKTPEGNRVFIQGIVDRVDFLELNGEKYLRVVDYKSGSKSFRLVDVYYGLNMQMLIYLFTLSQSGETAIKGAVPAGVLYMPARENILTVDRGTPPDVIAAQKAKDYKMNGLVLDNISVLSQMEDGLSGMFIPAKLKKDGTLDSTSSVATLEEFGRIRRHVNRLICKMADTLSQGRVGAIPIRGMDYNPCTFCDYQSICQRTEEHPKREIVPSDREDVLRMLKEEANAAD